ncbi:MAG: ATP-binding protein [Chloroflexia bacterium]|nr:ATP-binding protein [Chloroflexia bacterium]
MDYFRTIQTKIEENLFKGKIIILYGARQVGKTTLTREIIKKHDNARYINCELIQYRTSLETTNSEFLKDFLGNYKLVILDEAQSVKNIGMTLKIIVDTYPNIQIIATGSSSFDLANKLSEPLTGRSRIYRLYPFSWQEILPYSDLPTMVSKVETLLRFGSYPEVYGKPEELAIENLSNIASNYLYKDILHFENLKRPDILINLLRALALQIGHEVSYNELSNLLKENINTIIRYIELLEKAFVIYRLPSFSRNLRSEISRGQKIYFYDLGIRNSLINNFNKLELRNDIGGLWENFCVIERLKRNENNRRFVNTYFWRTYQQKEIDYLEEAEGAYRCFEFKYNLRRKSKYPKEFIETYENSSFETITKENFYKFIS